MSSWEVTLSILKYPKYNHRTEDLEGDSDSEQWKEDEWNLLWLRADRGALNFLRLLSLITW